MQNKKLGVCIVGLGRVATSYYPGIVALNDLISFEAVVSREEAKGNEIAQKWGAKKVYTSYEEALKDPEIDAVILCLPHHLHMPYTVQACEAGKHVLCEKPMALNYEECKEMVSAAEKNSVRLMIGQSRRFYDAVLKSKEIADRGDIGKISSVTEWNLCHRVEDHPSTWRPDLSKSGGRIMPFWGVHLLDYILWLYGKTPVSVYACMNTLNHNWTGEDEAMLLMRFDEGEMASVHLSSNCRRVNANSREEVTGKIWDSKKNSIYERYVIGDKGTIYMDDETDLYVNGECLLQGDQKQSNFTTMLHEFTTAILEGREPLANGKQVMEVMKVVDAAFVSAKENRIVEIR